jgi:HD-like signal output (HDOD) protein
MQVANSPWFAGSGHRGRWTLKEAIVRLGLKKVGAIGQQIALINSFVAPEESAFDMRRFWEHSLACALVADKLVTDGLITLKREVSFNDYWLACLLHDIGLLVQGFFFADWFERIVRVANSDAVSYHRAELDMAGSVTHELVGELLMMKSRMPERLVVAVASHHVVGDSPAPLVALVHVANALVKELGLAYLKDEQVDYSPAALESLGLNRTGVRAVKGVLEESVVGQVKQLVRQCMHD